jgi:putative pyruvate formate lyase activating enzyme
MKNIQPAYLALHNSGELLKRGEQLWDIMRRCRLCPRYCLKNRLEGRMGTCEASAELEISSFNPHFGEEAPLVGRNGSGTIFFTHCNLRCVFCINWEISMGGQGYKRSLSDLSGMMLRLQGLGCHNINVVTPTHYLPHIVLALDIAAGEGLRIPLVYNTSGYERIEMLEYLDGIVDIYLADFKYIDSQMGSHYSSEAEDYPEVTKKALLEMHRQAGIAKPDDRGTMRKGLMIRHLVMPNNVSGSDKVIQWIGANLPKDTYVNIMSQYQPRHKAHEYPDIARPLTRDEYKNAVGFARAAGLTNLEIQGY